MSSISRSGRGVIVAALMGLSVLVLTPAAQAAGGTPGVRETVCAETLSVRTTEGNAWLGTLRHGQTFLVRSVSGNWAFGFAYGDINHEGRVEDGWFC